MMSRPSLGVVGVGAFGEFALKYLAGYFRVGICDSTRDLSDITSRYNVVAESLSEVARRDIVVLTVPVPQLEQVCRDIASYVRPTTLVIDLSSVKVRTCAILAETLGTKCELVSAHPLFGPQSGREGVVGLRLALIDQGTARQSCVQQFCERELGLVVSVVSADEHDRQLAYVQGITHLIANVFMRINPHRTNLSTKTYDLLEQSVDLVRHDSRELLRVIETENPYVGEAKQKFFAAVTAVERELDVSPDSGE